MKEREETKGVKLNIRITPKSHEKLLESFGKTTFGVFTDYLRALLEKRPVTIYYRNKSLDEFLEAAFAIKEELYTVGRNFEHAVKGLSTCAGGAGCKEAIDFVIAEEFVIGQKILEIKDLLIKIYDKCSQ